MRTRDRELEERYIQAASVLRRQGVEPDIAALARLLRRTEQSVKSYLRRRSDVAAVIYARPPQHE